MFSEIVKLVPQVDRSALNKLYSTLNQRFTTLAKRFSQGIKNAFKLAPFLIGTGFLAKLVNPLEKAEEIIDRILTKGGDAKDAADELETDAGKLLRLQALGEAKGIDNETMKQLLSRFQSALAQEQEKVAAPARISRQLAEESDPDTRRELQAQLTAANEERDRGGLLREFVDEKDTADAFFKFLQSIQKLEKSQRVVVQRQIFGDRARGKTSQLFNAPPEELANILSQLPTAAEFEKAVQRADQVGDVKDLRQAVTNAQDFVNKSQLVDENQVKAIDDSIRLRQKAEDETLKRFDSLKQTNIAVQELTEKFDKFATNLVENVAPSAVTAVNVLTTTVGNIARTLDANWNEFKSSRIYKYFSGGR